MAAHTQKRPVANGVAYGEYLQAVVRFDPDTFAQVRQRAIDEGTSFGEQIRILVDLGLETEAIAQDPHG